MKKVTAFIGSYRKGATYEAVRAFEKDLKMHGDIDFELVFLKDYKLEYCRGCKICFDKGEENCPVRDDRDLLIEKLNQSDGVIFATPNYSFQVSAPMKNLLDRLAFMFHRPRYFGKTFTSIVPQGFYGGRSIVKYLNNMGKNFGFRTTKGCVLRALEPTTEAAQQKNLQEIKKAAAGFYRGLMHPALPVPSLFRLMMFRMSRTALIKLADDDFFDYRHYTEKGWLESDYYYDTPMGPVKRIFGHLFDFMGRRVFKQA